MKAFVLDVSACMPWCCEDETASKSEAMLEQAKEGSELHVPSLWVWEILKVVGVGVRRSRIKHERGDDLAYLDLAKRLSLPLATLDRELRNAPIAEGVELAVAG
jgi:predicted nucleic acid-binding protein